MQLSTMRHRLEEAVRVSTAFHVIISLKTGKKHQGPAPTSTILSYGEEGHHGCQGHLLWKHVHFPDTLKSLCLANFGCFL